MARKFERGHSIASFLKEIGELAGRILAAFGAAYASCNLFPVSHEDCELMHCNSGEGKHPERKEKSME
jgi:hypothetical protein